MNERQNIEQKVNRALESLDGIGRAETAPWFYTRLKARLEKGEGVTVWERAGSFLARPAVVITGLCVILVANLTLLLQQPVTKPAPTAAVQSETVVESESLIASSSSFEYENLAP